MRDQAIDLQPQASPKTDSIRPGTALVVDDELSMRELLSSSSTTRILGVFWTISFSPD